MNTATALGGPSELERGKRDQATFNLCATHQINNSSTNFLPTHNCKHGAASCHAYTIPGGSIIDTASLTGLHPQNRHHRQQLSGSHAFGAGRKRGYTEISELDEESYARKHLASEASVYFRRKSKYPRSFLWRVLDDRRLLEVQCVDLVHERDDLQREGSLTFHIELPTEIVRRGVAFADPEETDALEVFVLTTGNDLYTITLKADLLARTVRLPNSTHRRRSRSTRQAPLASATHIA